MKRKIAFLISIIFIILFTIPVIATAASAEFEANMTGSTASKNVSGDKYYYFETHWKVSKNSKGNPIWDIDKCVPWKTNSMTGKYVNGDYCSAINSNTGEFRGEQRDYKVCLYMDKLKGEGYTDYVYCMLHSTTTTSTKGKKKYKTLYGDRTEVSTHIVIDGEKTTLRMGTGNNKLGSKSQKNTSEVDNAYYIAYVLTHKGEKIKINKNTEYKYPDNNGKGKAKRGIYFIDKENWVIKADGNGFSTTQSPYVRLDQWALWKVSDKFLKNINKNIDKTYTSIKKYYDDKTSLSGYAQSQITDLENEATQYQNFANKYEMKENKAKGKILSSDTKGDYKRIKVSLSFLKASSNTKKGTRQNVKFGDISGGYVLIDGQKKKLFTNSSNVFIASDENGTTKITNTDSIKSNKEYYIFIKNSVLGNNEYQIHFKYKHVVCNLNMFVVSTHFSNQEQGNIATMSRKNVEDDFELGQNSSFSITINKTDGDTGKPLEGTFVVYCHHRKASEANKCFGWLKSDGTFTCNKDVKDENIRYYSYNKKEWKETSGWTYGVSQAAKFTTENGTVTISGLPKGKNKCELGADDSIEYKVFEITAPEGYNLEYQGTKYAEKGIDATKEIYHDDVSDAIGTPLFISESWTGNQGYVVSNNQDQYTINVENYKEQKEERMLTISKKDGTKDENLAGAKVTVYNTITKKYYKPGEKSSSEEVNVYYAEESNNKIEFEIPEEGLSLYGDKDKGLPPGIYEVTETVAPDGFLSPQEQESQSADEEIKPVTVVKNILIDYVYNNGNLEKEKGSNSTQSIELINIKPGQKGNLKIYKKDAITEKYLGGAKVVIVDRNGNYWTKGEKTDNGYTAVKTGTTKTPFEVPSDGIMITDLPVGSYSVIEVEAPPDYPDLEIQKNNDAVVWQETVFVSSNEEISYDEESGKEESSSTTVILENISETGYITVIKQDADTGENINGAYVSIRDENGNYYNQLGLKCSQSESLIPVEVGGTRICVLIDHTYTISEVIAPAGYYSVSKQDELGMTTSVSGVKVNETVILKNKKVEPGKARIIKRDVVNSSIQLKGTRVTIQDQEGSYYDSYGREYYSAISIEVPEDGLLIDKLPKQKEKPIIKTLEIVEIKDETEEENTTGETATKIKEYKEKGKENDKKAKIYTVADGTIYTKDEKTYIDIITGTYFIDLTYTVTEVQSPDGYPSVSVQNSYAGRRDGTVTSGYIDPNAKNITDVILKNARYANLEINKIDEETNEPIEGIGFIIEDESQGGYIASDGSHTSSRTIVYTNSQGKISISNILMYNSTGKFKVTEADSKNVYYSTENDTNGITKEIMLGTGSSYTNTLTFTNKKDYAFKLEKIDLDKKSVKNLKAEILLQYEDGTWLTCDEQGKIEYVNDRPSSGITTSCELKKVKRGTYHIYEIKAPYGYCLEYQDGYDSKNKWVDIGEITINKNRTISKKSDSNGYIDNISSGKNSPTVTIGNHKYVTVKGFVWEEIAKKGKDDYNNYFDENGDSKLKGIEVNIIKDGESISETESTGDDGNYELAYDLNGVRLVYWDLENAYVQFKYDKGTYVTVTVNETYPTDKIYSRAIENDYDSDIDGYDDKQKDQDGYAITRELSKYYKEESYLIETVNLGLMKKIIPDYSIWQTLEYVKLTKGDYAFKYNIGDDAIPDESVENQKYFTTVQGQTTTYPTFTQPIYPSDIRYNSSGNIDDKEKYKVYVIYKISVHNNQPAETRDFAKNYLYNEQVLELKSLVNNYNQQTDDGLGSIRKYELDTESYVDTIDGANDSQFKCWKANSDNQATFDVNNQNSAFKDGIAPKGTKSTYIQFRVTDEALNTLVRNDLTRDETKNFFKCASDIETTAWHKYSRNDSYWDAGGSEYTKENIHYSVTTEKTARALFIKLKLKDTRTISGTVFEDKRTEQSEKDNTRVGDGKFNEGIEKKLSDVIVSLVAPIPSKDSDGNTVTEYKVVNTYNDNLVQGADGKWTAKTSPAITKVGENGTYSIPGVVPGTYYLQFDYGDGEIKYTNLDGKEIKSKDGIFNIQEGNALNIKTIIKKDVNDLEDSDKEVKTKDYKSTILTGPAKPLKDNEKLSEYWFIDNINGKTNNVATDTDDIITIRTNNDKEMNFSYDPNNGKTVLTARTPEIKLNFEYVANKETAINTATSLSTNLTGMCFGIIERPKTDMTLNKEISNVKITLQNGTTLINGNPANVTVSAFLSNLTSGDAANGVKNAKIETDLEKLYGSELEVTYKLTVTNKSEVDYADKKYYKFGIENDDKLVTTIPSKVIDYISEDSEYVSFEGGEITEKLDDLFKEENTDGVKAGSGKAIEDEYKNKYFSDEAKKSSEKLNKLLIVSNTELQPEAKNEDKSKEIYTVVVKKQINNLKEDINLESFAEIIGLKNLTGITQSISTPGNYNVSLTGNELETDEDKAIVSVVPSTGKDKSYTIYIISGTILIVIAGGIILIKKFVV